MRAIRRSGYRQKVIHRNIVHSVLYIAIESVLHCGICDAAFLMIGVVHSQQVTELVEECSLSTGWRGIPLGMHIDMCITSHEAGVEVIVTLGVATAILEWVALEYSDAVGSAALSRDPFELYCLW
jgi:hypothetical protein